MPLVAPPTFQQALSLSRKGVFFACASCRHLWEGMAEGKETCTGIDCGGPSKRKDFPEYDGPVTDFSALCFICGSEDTLAYAKVTGSEKKFGLCKNHLETLDNILGAAPPVNGVIQGNGQQVLIFPREDRSLPEFREAQHAI